MPVPLKPLYLPWHQELPYWIGVYAASPLLPAPDNVLKTLGLHLRFVSDGHCYLIKTTGRWDDVWERLEQTLTEQGVMEQVEAVLVMGESEPDTVQILSSRYPVAKVSAIAKSQWLGDALLCDNVLCYLQPILSAKEKVFGYESFVRVRRQDGSITGGDAMVEAARALDIEYAIDRQLHIQAVTTFVSCELHGSLFINCIPRFIQHPHVYLEGLNESVRAHGVVPRSIVLNLMSDESPHDITYVQRIVEFCRSKGYALSLDDIDSCSSALTLVAELRPDFVKLDIRLVGRLHQPSYREVVRQITEHCHCFGVMVVAEGVEDETTFARLKDLEVDLFQGYLFSRPVPVHELQEFRHRP